MATKRRKPFRASTVRRKRKPAGSTIEPNPKVEAAHVGFLASWADTVSAVQRSEWPAIRKLIESEQRRLGTRSDGIRVATGNARRDQTPSSLPKINSLVRSMIADYTRKVTADKTKSEKRAVDIEQALEGTSSTAWALNIESLLDLTPGIGGDEKSEIADFLIAEEPNIPRSVRRSWIREQLGLIGGKPISPIKVAGKVIESISGRSMKRLRSIVTKGILRGTRVESIMGQLSELTGITFRHAELLARDQVVKQNARMTRIRHEGIAVTHYTWQKVGDDRVRKTHKAFGRGGGQRYSYKKGAGPNGVNPGEEIQCFPADTSILASGIVRVTRRIWDGELTTMVTASGVRLRSTPNHPVLTGRGWIGLGSLERGDYLYEVVRDGSGVGDADQGMVSIGDMFESARGQGMSPDRAHGGQFHGDASNEQVDIVSIHGVLDGDREARSNRCGLEFVDSRSAKPRPSKRQVTEMLSRLRLTTSGPVRGLDSSDALFDLHAGPTSSHGVRSATNHDTTLIQRSPDGVAIAPEDEREFELGNSGLVLRAHLVDSVSNEKWIGHVFNAETTTGWYQAQGFVVSNCRCWASPDLLGAVRALRKRKARGDSMISARPRLPGRVPRRRVLVDANPRIDATRGWPVRGAGVQSPSERIRP